MNQRIYLQGRLYEIPEGALLPDKSNYYISCIENGISKIFAEGDYKLSLSECLKDFPSIEVLNPPSSWIEGEVYTKGVHYTVKEQYKRPDSILKEGIWTDTTDRDWRLGELETRVVAVPLIKEAESDADFQPDYEKLYDEAINLLHRIIAEVKGEHIKVDTWQSINEFMLCQPDRKSINH